jgi:DNA repair exonuclease SbcCD ATPase subunit
MSRVISLEAQHIQKLKAFKLEVDQKVTKIIGENGSGKSTVLNLWNWLIDTRSIPSEVVTHGEKRGVIQSEVELTTEDLSEVEITNQSGTWLIKKVFNPSGVTLTIYPKTDGEKIPRPIKSPQDFLNKLFGPVSFNPLTFCESHKEKQQEILFSVIPGFKETLDGLDTVYQEKYEARADFRKEINSLTEQLRKIPEVEEITRKDPVELMDKYREWDATNKYNTQKREDLKNLSTEIEDIILDGKRLKDEETRITDEITVLQERLKEVQGDIVSKRELLKQKRVALAPLEIVIKKLVDYDLEIVTEEIKGIEAINIQATHWEAKQTLSADLEVKRKLRDDAEAEMQRIKKEKDDHLQNANYPIKGLTYSDDGIRYNATLVGSLSKAERVLVGLAILSRTNPKLKFVVIDDAEGLVGDSKDIVINWAEENDMNVIIAVASVDPYEQGIIIEDGEVKRNDYRLVKTD